MRASLTRRLSVTAAAALLAVAVPAAPAASAQPESDPGEPAGQTGSGPAPPPPEGKVKPKDNGQPDLPYTPKSQAVCAGELRFLQPASTIPWAQNVLQFDELNRFATGAGQTVAVIDTGVNPHEFLGNRLAGGGDYVERGGDGLRDCDGHGTEVAGIIAAKPKDDSIGFRGIAPDAKILSIRQSSDYYEYKPPNPNDRSDKAGSLTTLARAIVHAADRNVDVINMSVDTCRTADKPITPEERNLQQALRYAVEDRDVVVVASAGNIPSAKCPYQNSNDPKHPTYIVSPPWFSDYVLSVAAVNTGGTAAEFSMHGPWVSVAAPGTALISLNPGGGELLTDRSVNSQHQEGSIQGTSFAAPYVAGLAALIREAAEKAGNPLTAREVMDRIKRTASHPAGPGGRNSQIGYGMINPVGALTAKIPGQDGITGDEAIDLPYQVPPARERNWTPERVAVIGSAGGLGLLLLTLFIVHTVRRQRRDRPGPA
ncbi:MAG TPA: type VII secretion-associated serine protease mycosin [Actinophytocola sp.]|uniref:type VII secretion-associated serine protease mycosin n=1 Tax=Actinophytocola sp. TaxID=1872138 RepID=UPI002F937390